VKFVHASSLAPILIALGARATLKSPRGERTVAVADLFRTPAAEGERETVLAPDELLLHLDVPAATPHSATVEIRHRRGLDWPQAAAACALSIENGKVTDAALVLGHVAPTPWTVATAGLVGRSVEEAAAAAGEAAAQGATPLPSNGHKVELAKVAARRAVLAAARQSF